MMFNFTFIKYNITCRSIVCGYVLFCLLISANCFAEEKPSAKGDIGFYESPPTSVGVPSTLSKDNMFVKIDKKLHRKFVEFLSFVSAYIESITNKEAKKKNESIEYYSKKEIHFLILLSITGVFFVLTLHLLIDAIYRFILWVIDVVVFTITVLLGRA